MFAFEKFNVYIKAEEFLNNIQPILKNKSINNSMRDQLYRASSSILLNLAEGAGKFGKRDKRNFYTIARGSAQECASILRILKIEKNLEENSFILLYDKLDEICRMLTGLVNSNKY